MISHLEKFCNFEDAVKFFKELFTPYRRDNSCYTSEQIKNLTQHEILHENPYIGVESIVVYMANKGIRFDDQESIKKIRMQDVLSDVDNEFG